MVTENCQDRLDRPVPSVYREHVWFEVAQRGQRSGDLCRVPRLVIPTARDVGAEPAKQLALNMLSGSKASRCVTSGQLARSLDTALPPFLLPPLRGLVNTPTFKQCPLL